MVFAALICLASPAAFADDPSELLYFGIVQFLLVLWPLLLPLAFLGGQTGKLRRYFLLTLATFGIEGLISFPLGLFTQVASWLEIDFINWWRPLYMAKSAFAFAVCLWFLPRFRKLILYTAA